MRKAKGALASVAAVVGFVAVLVAHVTGGVGSPASLRGGSNSHKPSGHSKPSSSGSSGTGSSGSVPSTGTHTATGKLVNYGYGEIAVKLTVSSGRIVSVKVATLRTAESYSTQIANQAIPMLSQEVVAAQSAHISAISGATYTSYGYADSLQSALDSLKS